MKDLPHHIKKLNRRVIRSTHREEMGEEAYSSQMPSPPPQKQTVRQLKKQAKNKMKQERLSRTPSPLTPEEQNKKMSKRVPIFDRFEAAPRFTKPTKKKTPRI